MAAKAVCVHPVYQNRVCGLCLDNLPLLKNSNRESSFDEYYPNPSHCVRVINDRGSVTADRIEKFVGKPYPTNEYYPPFICSFCKKRLYENDKLGKEHKIPNNLDFDYRFSRTHVSIKTEKISELSAEEITSIGNCPVCVRCYDHGKYVIENQEKAPKEEPYIICRKLNRNGEPCNQQIKRGQRHLCGSTVESNRQMRERTGERQGEQFASGLIKDKFLDLSIDEEENDNPTKKVKLSTFNHPLELVRAGDIRNEAGVQFSDIEIVRYFRDYHLTVKQSRDHS